MVLQHVFELLDLENKEVEYIWIKIQKDQMKGWLIVTLYLPNYCSKYFKKDFNIHLKDMFLNYQRIFCWVM